jgi:hypothetical protein
MGTRPADDRFVVITDGEPLMHLILMWRDDIPADWQALAPGLDPRIACDVPIDFGRPGASESLSEQSVLVRGNAAVVVNNLLQHRALLSRLPPALAPLVELVSGTARHRPHGLERVDWDPASRSCHVVWANPDISIPNGIPTLSASSGVIYGVGSRTLDGADTWTLEGVDFDSARSRFFVPAGPAASENSFYAATEVGPGHSVWTGTLGGITRYRTCRAGHPANCVMPSMPTASAMPATALH